MHSNKITATTQLSPLLSVSEFCRLFNLSRGLFYSLPPENRPRVVLVGRKKVIRHSDALAWLDSLQEPASK